MELKLYSKIIHDKDFFDFKKLRYKYPEVNFNELTQALKDILYTTLSLKDFKGNSAVYAESFCRIKMQSVKHLLKEQELTGESSLEQEIKSTLSIENIDSSRESVRRILSGMAPQNKDEEYIYGIKKGLEFVNNKENIITEDNLKILYDTAIGRYTSEENKLLPGNLYRHDSVYVVGNKIEHTGINHTMLKKYMKNFISFINSEFDGNELVKSAMIHFYIAYLHPYFDGNGRIARLVQLWYLVQSGYSSTLFIPFSSYINKTKEKYYKAFTQIEENMKISNLLDITPFIVYFAENVFNKIEYSANNSYDKYKKAVNSGEITPKEAQLWKFVLSVYGVKEFSTKELEKDFHDAAYATIRSFVLKFKSLGFLSSVKYKNRVKYKIK